LAAKRETVQKMATKSSVAQRNLIKALLEQKNIEQNKWEWLTHSTKSIGDNGYLSSISLPAACTLIAELKKLSDSENPLRAGFFVRSR